MMKMTERLKAEHGVFFTLLDHLDDMLRRRASREALQATLDAIASAEEQHALFEERLLFRMLAEELGHDFAPLQSLQTDHRQVERLAEQVRVGSFTEEVVRAYSRGLRRHLEQETHYLFPLVDELVSEEKLTALSNWDEEHVVRAARGTAPSDHWLG